MRVALLCTPSLHTTCRWLSVELSARGLTLDEHQTPVTDVATAVAAGHRLADRWSVAGTPDVVLALGWEAGLTAQVATRPSGTPVVLRLTRAGREPGSERCRLEKALARGSSLVLVPSVGETQRLVDLGVPRSLLSVLPDAVDRRRYSDSGPALGADGDGRAEAGSAHRVAVALGGGSRDLLRRLMAMPGCRPVALSTGHRDEELAASLRGARVLVAADDSDEEVALVLRAMSCGVPVVAADVGVLSDLVADGVTGVLTPRSRLGDALRSLLADPMRRESLGLAAVDRVRARFDTAVVGDAAHRALRHAVESRTADATEPEMTEVEDTPVAVAS